MHKLNSRIKNDGSDAPNHVGTIVFLTDKQERIKRMNFETHIFR
jgi:hypothetical protein